MKAQRKLLLLTTLTSCSINFFSLLGGSTTEHGQYHSNYSNNGRPIVLVHAVHVTSFNQYPNELIRRAHSHNDYHQDDPLESALKHGIRSIEVDVFPIENELLVGHSRFDLEKELTIDDMYIKPMLQSLIQGRKSAIFDIHTPGPTKQFSNKAIFQNIHIHKFLPAALAMRRKRQRHAILNPCDDALILLVDFKADPDLSAKLLGRAIRPLIPYLSKVKNGKFEKGAVTVIISGHRPKRHCLFSEEEVGQQQQQQKQKKEMGLFQRPLFRGGSSIKRDGQCIITTPSLWGKGQSLISARMKHREHLVDDKATRYLFLDGRMRDLNSEEDSSLVPLVSMDWNFIRFRNLFCREGDEVMKQMTERAHSQGKRIRIWGAPNTEKSWTKMLKTNVDWLSIDDHERFVRFVKRADWRN